jgi:hypothetical protein
MGGSSISILSTEEHIAMFKEIFSEVFDNDGDGIITKEGAEGTEMDNEIALLEAQLEIARIEARILMLRKTAVKKTDSVTSATSTPSDSNIVTSSEDVGPDEEDGGHSSNASESSK